MNAVGNAAGVVTGVVANAILPSSTDPFMDAVKGRVPLSKSVSAARTWSPTGDDTNGQYVPRPDRSLNALKWFSTLGGVLGLDHFYLRSPTTGFFKLLIGLLVISYFAFPSVFGYNTIVVIILLLWVIWDVLQVWCEPSRILNYGMSLPFDFGTGIGQGMVSDLPISYEQNSSFIWWGLSLIFGFLGIDSWMVGQPGVMIRKWFDALILYFTAKAASEGGYNYLWLIMVIPLAAFLIIPWLINMYWFVFKPSEMFEKGIQLPNKIKSFFNYFTAWFSSGKRDKQGNFTTPEEEEKQKLQDAIVSDFGYGSVSAKEMKEKFSIFFPGEGGENSSTDYSASETWPISLLFSSFYTIPFGVVSFLLVKIWEPTLTIASLYPIEKDSNKSGTSIFNDFFRGATGGLGPAALDAANEYAKSFSQRGGARKEPLSTEAKILGASIIAIITGGSLKGLVDYLMKE